MVANCLRQKFVYPASGGPGPDAVPGGHRPAGGARGLGSRAPPRNMLPSEGGITQGLDYLQKALDLDPMNHTIYIQMASLNYQTQQYDRGLIYAEQGLSLFPAQSVFYLLTARGHKEKGALKQALSYLEMGLDYVLDHEREGRLIYQEGAAIYQALGQDTNAELWRQKGQIKNNE